MGAYNRRGELGVPGRRERRFGSFRRTLELPGEVDESKIVASFKKGVLKVELPRTKEAQSKIKHIDVKAA